jgi:hypothetical protein
MAQNLRSGRLERAANLQYSDASVGGSALLTAFCGGNKLLRGRTLRSNCAIGPTKNSVDRLARGPAIARASESGSLFGVCLPF